MDQFTVFVTGGNTVDRKIVERAMNSVHGKRRISTVITGDRAGAEEVSLWWAVQKPIRTVIVIPRIGRSMWMRLTVCIEFSPITK